MDIVDYIYYQYILVSTHNDNRLIIKENKEKSSNLNIALWDHTLGTGEWYHWIELENTFPTVYNMSQFE